jgi:hypothetical protein
MATERNGKVTDTLAIGDGHVGIEQSTTPPQLDSRGYGYSKGRGRQ